MQALRRSLLDPHLRAYASRDRLQGRRPQLPVTGSIGICRAIIRVAADFPFDAAYRDPMRGGSLDACRWAGARLS